MSISNPHDRFFRQSFGDRQLAADFLTHYLPDELAAQLDLTTLAPVEGSFVDTDLQEHQADLLFEVRLRTGEEVSI